MFVIIRAKQEAMNQMLSKQEEEKSEILQLHEKVTISPTFYKRLFYMKVFFEDILWLQFVFCIVLAK